MRCRAFAPAILFLIAAMIMGCSGSSDPVQPELQKAVAADPGTHQLWGLWQFQADPVNQKLDVVSLRSGEFHLNALPFLEPPAMLNLTLEYVEFNGNQITADIGLRHPFLGLTEFTGFDVCGIFITNGSVSGYTDSTIVMAGDGDTHLGNPDGYTRWWNPEEYPVNDGTIFAYNDGLLGAPNSCANFNCTVNGYKFYCDSLDVTTNIHNLDPTTEICEFSAGQKNVRRYIIELGDDGLVFNYAIDANWMPPVGSPPYVVPDSFPAGAWRTEAWNLTVTELDNSLWNDGVDNGGDLSLEVEIWAHGDASNHTIYIDSPGDFPQASTSVATGGGVGYSTYQIDIANATPAEGSIDLLITAEAPILDASPYAYFTYSVEVSPENQGPVECGTQNHGNPQQFSFSDQPTSTIRFDVAWLVNGPYSGEMLVGDYNGTVTAIRRYNMDTIGNKSGSEFAALPAIACPPAPYPYTFNPFLFHLKVEPNTGRVIAVPFGLGANNSLLVWDNQGNQLTPDTGISVGAGRKIQAIYANDNGDLWLMTVTQLNYTWGDDCRLQKYEYQSGAPYYVHDPAFDLELDDIIGSPYGSYGNAVVNHVVDLVILYPQQRIFVWESGSFMQHNGRLWVFDINTSTPPTHMSALSNPNLLSYGTWNSHTDYFTVENAGICVDHASSQLEECRVSVYARCRDDGPPVTSPTILARLDGDGNILNETNYGNGIWAYTMGINHDPDPTKANLVFTGYGQSNNWMCPPPPDW